MIFLHFQAALWIVFIAWFGFSAFSSAYISSIERGFSEKKGFSTFRLKPFSASGRALQTDKPAHFNIESPPLLLKKSFFQPENVVCTQKDNTTVKIIDFGTAKELEPGTAVKVLCGTPEFVAPEVIFTQFCRNLKCIYQAIMMHSKTMSKVWAQFFVISGGQIRLHIHRIG